MKCTNWSQATLDYRDAVVALLACLKEKHYAWLELQNNGDQDHPIKVKNPALLQHENWTMLYGVPTVEKTEVLKKSFFNKTEKDLTLNYIAAFGNPIKKINRGMCECFPLKKKSKYIEWWTYYWQPKDHIPYYIAKKMKQKVYVVVYDDSKTITEKEVIPIFKKAIYALDENKIK